MSSTQCTLKKCLESQNPLKVFVRKWSKFDRQNSVIDSLLDEIDNKKERRKYLKIIQIVPDIGDLDLENKQIKIVEITKR